MEEVLDFYQKKRKLTCFILFGNLLLVLKTKFIIVSKHESDGLEGKNKPRVDLRERKTEDKNNSEKNIKGGCVCVCAAYR